MSVQNGERLATKQDLADMYQEILPYLGGSADAGFTPIGTIIPMIAETAPANYLICDGATYNKSDYPELAAHLLALTTHSQYEVDGDATKFKVPDLRGEFLRGTGTNSHSGNGNGANVGVHQDATQIPNFGSSTSTSTATSTFFKGSSSNYPNFSDSQIGTATKAGFSKQESDLENTSALLFTTRPTNTSVLYCIATKNIYLNPALDYSTEEKVVGTWVDGSTLYQKTVEITFTEPVTNIYTIGQTEKTPAQLGISGTINVKYIEGINDNGAPLNRTWSATFSNTDPKYCTGIYFQHVLFNDSSQKLIIQTNRTGNNKVYVTLRYTKTT